MLEFKLEEHSKHEICDCNGGRFTLSNAVGRNNWSLRGRF